MKPLLLAEFELCVDAEQRHEAKTLIVAACIAQICRCIDVAAIKKMTQAEVQLVADCFPATKPETDSSIIITCPNLATLTLAFTSTLPYP
jgi:hypothetical protein